MCPRPSSLGSSLMRVEACIYMRRCHGVIVIWVSSGSSSVSSEEEDELAGSSLIEVFGGHLLVLRWDLRLLSGFAGLPLS